MTDATTIQLRADIAANWAEANPVLAIGEAALEMDTNKIKFGDGVTAYTGLEYWFAGGGGTAALTSTYVGYGNGSNVLTGNAHFTYTYPGTKDILTLGEEGLNFIGYDTIYNRPGIYTVGSALNIYSDTQVAMFYEPLGHDNGSSNVIYVNSGAVGIEIWDANFTMLDETYGGGLLWSAGTYNIVFVSSSLITDVYDNTYMNASYEDIKIGQVNTGVSYRDYNVTTGIIDYINSALSLGYQIVDPNNGITYFSIDASTGNAYLNDQYNYTSMNWCSRCMYDTTDISIDWQNKYLRTYIPYSGGSYETVLDWGNGYFINGSGYTVATWRDDGFNIFDSTGNSSYDADGRALIDSSGVFIMDGNNRILYNSSNIATISWNRGNGATQTLLSYFTSSGNMYASYPSYDVLYSDTIYGGDSQNAALINSGDVLHIEYAGHFNDGGAGYLCIGMISTDGGTVLLWQDNGGYYSFGTDNDWSIELDIVAGTYENTVTVMVRFIGSNGGNTYAYTQVTEDVPIYFGENNTLFLGAAANDPGDMTAKMGKVTIIPV